MMLSWACQLFSIALEGTRGFSALCGSLIQFSLFSLPAKFEVSWVFFQQTAVTYA
jgi:hypothetical protein